MKITEINGLDDTVIEREATAEEKKQILDHQNELQAAKESELVAIAETAAKKTAVLERLGITEDEAKALLS